MKTEPISESSENRNAVIVKEMIARLRRKKAAAILSQIKRTFVWAYIVPEHKFADQIPKRLVEDRHTARVAACWAMCIELGQQYWPRVAKPEAPDGAKIAAAQAVAMLALLGQGGPQDLGGPRGIGQLPLLNRRLFNWRSKAGQPWIAALKEVAAHTALSIYLTEGRVKVVMIGIEDPFELWSDYDGRFPDSSLRAALRRAVLGERKWVTGETVSEAWHGDFHGIDPDALRLALALRIYPEG